MDPTEQGAHGPENSESQNPAFSSGSDDLIQSAMSNSSDDFLKSSFSPESGESKTSESDETEADENGTDEEKKPEPKGIGDAIKMGLKETLDTFKAFVKAPREIIGVNIINVFEGMAYFGILTELMLFLTKNVMLDDVTASLLFSGFLMLITFSQFFLGTLSDKLGARRVLGVSIIILLIARIILGFSEGWLADMGRGVGSPLFFAVCGSLLMAAVAYGVFNPSVYSITRMYSDEKTSAVSYAMLYAGMNLGAFIIGLILPNIRSIFGDELDDKGAVIREGLMPGTNGISATLLFIAGIMVVVFLLYLVFLAFSHTKPFVDPKEDKEEKDDDDDEEDFVDGRFFSRVIEKIKSHPLADGKFAFFIFILIPVQTLFAYQNILIPTYLERCYREFPTISGNYETFSNINPLIVFLFAPIIAALTAKQNVYKMMIIGTAVMAVPSFLLCLGQTPFLFLTFILIGSIGESIWQPRFLQHVTQIAPKDKMGTYVGIANMPWFLTKLFVGLYVGFFMRSFIPDPSTGQEQNPTTMWLIFACVACISPVALFLARNWAGKSDKAQKTSVQPKKRRRRG